MTNGFTELFGQLLLPLFVMALLFGLAGVGPELVVRAAASVVAALIEGTFKCIAAIVTSLLRPHSSYHKTGDSTPTHGKSPDKHDHAQW